MNRVDALNILLFLFLYCLPLSSSSNAVGVNFAVGLTTIPPRFSYIYHTVGSWLQQSIVPRVIVVFIPSRYKNFLDGLGRNKNKNVITVTRVLEEHFPDELRKGLIVVQGVDHDSGPLTKYTGMLESFLDFEKLYTDIDAWVIGDDDVHYDASTLQGYVKEAATSSGHIQTYFQTHPRLAVDVSGKQLDIPHLQGVDTIMFPKSVLINHTSAPNDCFCFAKMDRVARFLHKECPASFFQDDYVVSASIFACHISVQSLWRGSMVAQHINGVSTSLHQMHRHEQVSHREDITKACIVSSFLKIDEMFRSHTHKYSHQGDNKPLRKKKKKKEFFRAENL